MNLAISLAFITRAQEQNASCCIDLENVTNLKWKYCFIFHVKLYALFDPQQNMFHFCKKKNQNKQKSSFELTQTRFFWFWQGL